MAGKTHPLRLGIFVFLGMVLTITAIFLIGNKESLFSKTFKVRAFFSSIEGLRIGAPVRLSGIDVGTVKSIEIAADSIGKVEVVFNLEASVKKFIKADATATIETEGLVGNKVITLQTGSPDAPAITDNAAIRGVTPLGFGAIIEETKTTLTYTKDMTKNLAEIIAKVNRGQGSVGKFINSEDLYNHTNSLIVTADKSLSSISNKLDSMSIVVNSLLTGVESVISNVNQVVGNMDKVIANIDNVIYDVNGVINDVRAGKGIVGKLIKDNSSVDSMIAGLIANLLVITSSTKSGAEKFAENMEALKHNWLFKSYFEQRGVYDATEYEKQLDVYIKQINERIRTLDERIETLRKMKTKQ
jgi:phospholipid/cholesterol/gamma-HCH transport system substrate-binding protein